MKVLHTGDLHLRETGDERWQALRKLVDLARTRDVGIFVVSGDLFDREVDAETLRVPLREVFSETGFEVFLLPGNHDSEAYGNRYFGADVHVLTEPEPVKLDGVTVVGLPYEPIRGEEVVSRILALQGVFDGTDVGLLIYHGELLDAVRYDRSPLDYGDEGAGRYMPVKLSYFESVSADYVLAGHFHSNFDVWRLPEGGFFVYPGSPVSITRRETGRRKVNLFELGEPPDQQLLDTAHFAEVEVKVDPFSGADPLALVREQLSKVHPQAAVILRVGGYFNGEELERSEQELAAELEEAAAGCVTCQNELLDISRVLNSDLFREFKKRLGAAEDLHGPKEPVIEMAIRAMMEAGL